MNWTALSSLFLLSTVKFMFAPFGVHAFKTQPSFIETFIACCAGAIVSSFIFYFAAEFFFKRSREKKLSNDKPTKVFTRSNKFIVKIKHTLGIIGVTFYCPFFLSIPLGSMIVAKFYGKKRIAYPLIVLGILFNGLITTSMAYFLMQ